LTVHIDEAVSELALEPEAQTQQSAGAHGAGPAWAELEHWRAARDRATQDAERTKAEGYGD
jgi:hypothetical protein